MLRAEDPWQEDPLRQCQKEYAQLKARLQAVGFICEGSLARRWMRCGKADCACARDQARRHGPYFDLTWKEQGKTVSRRLSPEQAMLYREWVANRQHLQAIVQKMQQVSRKARRYLLGAQAARKLPPKPRDMAPSDR